MATKKQPAKIGRVPPKSKSVTGSNDITLTDKELRIRYENSLDLQNKLFRVTQHVAHLHASQSLVTGAAAKANVLTRFSASLTPTVLGQENAAAIVSSCAGTNSDSGTALGDIPGLDLRIFQNCVQKGIMSAGFKPGAIPASSSNTLNDVIDAIAGSASN